MERGKWLILSTVSLGTFMATLDGSIVNIALPQIQEAFGVDLATVEWVVVAYLLVVGSLLLPFGRLGEVLTFKRVYLTGFVVFTVTSALCGAAPSASILVLFRVFQGVGAAMLQAMGPAIVARTFGPRERGRALGLNSISVALGLTLGPALGGLLTEVGSWRAIFLINVPVGIVAVLWAARILPFERQEGRQSFDVAGAALSSVALFALLLALIEGQTWGWTSPATIALVLTCVVLGLAFIVVERRVLQPMVDLTLFRIRAFSAGLASVGIAFSGLFTATFLLPFLLEQSAGFTPLEAGLLLTPIPVMTAIVAPFSGALSDRIGPRLPASVGIGTMALGLFSLTQLPADFAVTDLVWRLAVIGVGQGLFMSPNSSAILGAVPRGRIGTASGTLAQMRIDGQALGIALSGAIVAARLPVHFAQLAGHEPPAQAAQEALALAIHDAFIVAALLCGVGILTSALRGFSLPPRMSPAPEPVADRSGSS
ncbi:MAG: DHA2 family efflux MFS transporter permease subunit [Candidatus Limnocylindrales bacterium]